MFYKFTGLCTNTRASASEGKTPKEAKKIYDKTLKPFFSFVCLIDQN